MSFRTGDCSTRAAVDALPPEGGAEVFSSLWAGGIVASAIKKSAVLLKHGAEKRNGMAWERLAVTRILRCRRIPESAYLDAASLHGRP